MGPNFKKIATLENMDDIYASQEEDLTILGAYDPNWAWVYGGEAKEGSGQYQSEEKT